MEKIRRPDKSGAAEHIQVAELIGRTVLSEKAFKLELTRPASFDFIPGQSIRFVYGDIQRYYSIISTPDEPKIELLVRHVADGAFTSVLSTTGIGARFDFTGPHGYFTFKPSSRPPVFIATGTGVAPFVSMCRSGVSGFTLLHGVSLPEDLYYESLFRRSECHYIPCISKSIYKGSMPRGAFSGTVTEYLRSELPRIRSDFYLCGRTEMVQEATLLIDECFPDSFVYSEVLF